jgi:hypothetical protein
MWQDWTTDSHTFTHIHTDLPVCVYTRAREAAREAQYMSHPIPGRLDLAALGRLHRPTDRARLRVSVVELARRGLTPRDISAASLAITESAARLLLAPPESLRGDP